MAMALLLTLVAMSLTAGLVPLVLGQITSTRIVDARTVALDAAQAGVDAAVGQLRGAVPLTTLLGSTTSVAGALNRLPSCAGTPLTGAVASVADLTASSTIPVPDLRFSFVIKYFTVPADATDNTPEPADCVNGLLQDVPSTALITSTGTGLSSTLLPTVAQGAANTRTIEATYTFRFKNENIDGGAIQLASPTTNPLCMDAGVDASPAPSSAVTVQLCKEGGGSDQRFSYTKDLAIELIGSENSLAPNGMCLEAPMPHKTDGALTFQPCEGRVAKQQWSLNDSSAFVGTTNGVSTDNFCINAKTAGSPSELVLGACGAVSNKNVWRPQAGVGAGMASAETKQLVNYKQFSRCLDVTNFDYTNSNVGYEIVWFCKQSPNGTVPVNQSWSVPANGATVLTPANTLLRTPNGYCLQTPETPAGYVTMAACSADVNVAGKRLKWTVYGDTGEVASSFRIVDSNGYCLTPTDLSAKPADTHSDGTAKVKVATCTSSDLQKWNAPPTFNHPLAVTNLSEK